MTFELSTLVTDFFVVHLAAERNASLPKSPSFPNR